MAISRRKLLYSSGVVFGLSGCTTIDEGTVQIDTENISEYCDMNCDIIERITLEHSSDPEYRTLKIKFTDILSSVTLDATVYDGYDREVDSLNININEDTWVLKEYVSAGAIGVNMQYIKDINISVYDWTKKDES